MTFAMTLDFARSHFENAELQIVAAYTKGPSKTLDVSHWGRPLVAQFGALKSKARFKGELVTAFRFYDEIGTPVYAAGLGVKNEVKAEHIRKSIAHAWKSAIEEKTETIAIDIDSFDALKNTVETTRVIAETILLTHYSFEKYKSKKTEHAIKTVYLSSSNKKALAKAQVALDEAIEIASSVNLCRDLGNEVPNVLHSVHFAELIAEDAKKNLKHVKVKILKKADIEKEKMGLLLAVNAGSAHEPRLVHLSYTPKTTTKKTKHIALIGKGLTFDTGGHNLKPTGSIAGMKFDMSGAGTVYAAFRAAVMLQLPHKISCVIPMTDNPIGERAIHPDSIITARSGKTVEINNTDAEGRLILADAIDYIADEKPDVMIDAATLTGACLVALGSEVCGLMGNNSKLTKALMEAAKRQDEYMWELPIIDEWKKDMSSKVADLKNTGSNRNAGASKGAAFLREFVKNDIAWAHLDIAGVAEAQSHLPYCPAHGASGLIVRSLVDYIRHV